MDVFMQTRKEVIRISILFICAAGLWAQNANIIVTQNTNIIAPGQVTTLCFTGAPTIIPVDSNGDALVQASKVPLPTTLAGFSATIGQVPYPFMASLPIFSVRQHNYCNGEQTPACTLTLLTVQIPTDLEISPFPVGPQINTGIEVLDGDAIWSVAPPLDPVKVHILTACDPAFGGSRPTTLSPCNPLITHADGTLVGPFSGSSVISAQPGETLVMYATGLGATQPGVPEGTLSPNPPAVSLHHFTMILHYDCGIIVAEAPVFVGLTPGQVGLYQVNFTVPQPVTCTTLPSGAGNLTLLSDDWYSSDTVLLYVGANTAAVNSTPQSINK
jgi:uncharacterized protein (TIGR03437 family)